MKKKILLSMLILSVLACNKPAAPTSACDINKTYSENAVKVGISSGVWGTVASMEGNFMPMVPPAPAGGTICPVKRTVRIYEYTTLANAIPTPNSTIFFDSFKTTLVKEITTDVNGFFQAEISAGTYTVVTIEEGKLYAGVYDGNGGINPVVFPGGLMNVNITLTYKAVF